MWSCMSSDNQGNRNDGQELTWVDESAVAMVTRIFLMDIWGGYHVKGA